MNKDFQPLYEESPADDFNVWEFKQAAVSEQALVDEQQQFAAECESLREEARQKGYEDGLQQAMSEMEALKQEFSQWLLLIQNPVRLVDKYVSQEIINTIEWICEACIGVELSNNPEKLMALIEEIKKELPSLQKNKQLMMNPDDVDWLTTQLGPQYKDITSLLVADPTLSRGDFFLKSDLSVLDGTLKTRLHNIFTAHFGSVSLMDNLDEFNNNDEKDL